VLKNVQKKTHREWLNFGVHKRLSFKCPSRRGHRRIGCEAAFLDIFDRAHRGGDSLHVDSRRIRDLRKDPAVLVPYLDLQLAPAGHNLDAKPECLRKLLDRSDNPLSRLPVDEKNSGKGENELVMFLQCDSLWDWISEEHIAAFRLTVA